MQTMVDALGMVMLILLGVIVILGMGIVIAYECRTINRLRKPEPLQSTYGPFDKYPTVPLYGEQIRRSRELS